MLLQKKEVMPKYGARVESVGLSMISIPQPDQLPTNPVCWPLSDREISLFLDGHQRSVCAFLFRFFVFALERLFIREDRQVCQPKI
jgi:hypothetical protein